MSTVLVVDDNAVDRKVVRGLLEKAGGLSVQLVESGAAALEMLRQSVPDVVITDLVMPEMDGFALVKAIVAAYPQVPIILMTGYGSEAIAVNALHAGAASYVPKSHLSSLLADTVLKLLEILRQQEQQQRLIGRLVRQDCEFELDNDPRLVPSIVHYMIRGLRGVGHHDESIGIRVSVALEEALNNAIYHGNLELSSALRELDAAEYREIVRQRREQAPYCERKVHVRAEISRDEARFRIRDEGPGFDPQSLPDPTDPSNLDQPSGRGVMLMRTFMDEVVFEPCGNEVTLVKRFAS